MSGSAASASFGAAGSVGAGSAFLSPVAGGHRLRRRRCRRRAAAGFAAGLASATSSALSPSPTRSGDRRVDLDVLGAFRDQDLAQRALVHRLEFHRRLVGLDLGDDVAGLDRVTFLLQPFGELALFHGGRKRRHQNVDRHGRFLIWGRRRFVGGPARVLPRRSRGIRLARETRRSAAPRPLSDRCRSTVRPGPARARAGRNRQPRAIWSRTFFSIAFSSSSLAQLLLEDALPRHLDRVVVLAHRR